MNNLSASAVILAGDYGTRTGAVRKKLESAVNRAFLDNIATGEQVARLTDTAAYRLCEAVEFCLTGLVAQCDEVTAPMFALVDCSAKDTVTFTDAQFFVGAVKDEAKHIDGASRQGFANLKYKATDGIARFVPRTSNMGTISSKVSRTVGQDKKQGFMRALGIASGDKHSFTILDRSHPLVVAYCAALSKMTDGQFEAYRAKGKGKKAGSK